eukprot:TRINITY_DN2047_c0_g1_i1.p1 TRINITY_DN2047_c0_g1~~TRINITY_DN2047_c0_g1_i1.p1  ORF type:complete len:651 (-),score=72.61 TRINITY_DN2047_c0_g1_i1:19-1743(-)
MTAFLKFQKRLRRVVRCQAIVRGHLVRKKYKEIYSKYLIEPHKTILNTFRMLFAKEKMYVKYLRDIVEGYMHPLRDKHLLSDKEITNVFGNIEEILRMHIEMLNLFSKVRDKLPVVEDLSTIFLTMAPLLKVYGNYVNNFGSSTSLLLSCQKRDKVSAFLKQRKRELELSGQNLSLSALLCMPFNHIPSYAHCIKKIVDATPDDDKERASMMHCQVLITQTADFIDHRMSRAEKDQAIKRVERRLSRRAGSLLVGERELVKEGKCTITRLVATPAYKINPKGEPGYFFAFTDLLIVAIFDKKDKRVTQSKAALTEIAQLRFDKTVVVEMGSTEVRLTRGPKLEMEFSFANGSAKSAWLLTFAELIGNYEDKRIFGVDLAKLCALSKDNIPAIMKLLIKHLINSNALSACGIFRISGTGAVVRFLRESFDRCGPGRESEVNLAMQNMHDVAGLLKLFLRELPEPVIIYDLYDQLVEITSTFMLNSDLPMWIEGTKKLLKRLPPENVTVLHYLVEFLIFADKHSEQSKMTLANLAIVFSPNLCKPREESIESALQLGAVNTWVKLLLENAEVCFPN